MEKIVLTAGVLITGEHALDYLGTISCKKAVIVTGGSSMERTGVLDRIREMMKPDLGEPSVYSGISKNPGKKQVMAGTEFLRREKPDVVIAVGGGSSIDAAKVMVLFYDHPELNFDNVYGMPLEDVRLKTMLVAVPSTSGTASEVTNVSVITDEETEFKMAIRAACLRPSLAILDGALPMTLPPSIAAETGMDALTHALEAYVNKNGNDFTDALAKEAAEGILEWLPLSVREGTAQARMKVHHYQCMAGMAFANSGLGMVHGVSHAFGGKYNMAHGRANAVILPYSMDYNKKDAEVAAKYLRLSGIMGTDIIGMVKSLQAELGIPSCMKDAGIEETDFRRDFDRLLDYSMQGSTAVNPVKVPPEDMKKFLECVYYGIEVDF
ncbi:MAG: iron-containing alcohol dehydrogenase [Clostridiales bacterium]|nr:iron-containing alcohol dehydrogenase [Clostridiales bacterium]